MKIQQIAILLFLFLTPSIVCYQEGKISNKQTSPSGYFLDRNQIQFNLPKNFVFVNTDSMQNNYKEVRLSCIVSKKYSGRHPTFTTYLISKDSNFIVYINVVPLYCNDEDSIYADTGFLPELKIKISTAHTSYILGDFFQNTGNRVATMQNLPVFYATSKYAHEAFNADTVIAYPLKMLQKHENKYDKCQVMLIQKNRRGCIFLYCLYKDMGFRRLNTYFESLKKVFWYREPKDYIEVVEPRVDSIYVIPHLKDKKTD